MSLSKEYIADIKFGVETDTMDIDGNITRRTSTGKLDQTKIKKILEDFTGKLKQVPPMYSALKSGGQPLYRLARKGIEVSRKTRNIDIYGIEVIGWGKDCVTIKVACSSGTYVRVLAHDIGKAYGTGAVLSGLRRTRIGKMSVDEAAGIEAITDMSGSNKDISCFSWIIGLEELLKDSISFYVGKEYEKQVKNGSRLSMGMLSKVPGDMDGIKNNIGLSKYLAVVRTTSGKLLAIHRMLEGCDNINKLNMENVFTKSVLIL
jgi:tRNA pseudouridine55 synthase